MIFPKNSGLREISTICLIKPCPPPSAGWALDVYKRQMDNYIVSARKYRPSTFRSVVGQKSLTTTLKNAIPVSYTHLEVYKRQENRCSPIFVIWELLSFSLDSSGDDFSNVSPVFPFRTMTLSIMLW